MPEAVEDAVDVPLVVEIGEVDGMLGTALNEAIGEELEDGLVDALCEESGVELAVIELDNVIDMDIVSVEERVALTDEVDV